VIALNKIRAAGAYHRAAKRDVTRTAGGDACDLADGKQAIHDESALVTLRLVIDEVLAGLPASYRQIVELRIEEYEVAEIAQRVGRSKRSVERVLQEFRALLAEIIQRDE
jgi:DNA-directed RNA polymerase specialized sigma24 family protein